MALPVLALHSGGMSSRQWRWLGERLGPSRRLVTPDFLGCGVNPAWPDDAPFTLSMDVEHVAGELDATSGRVHVVGHSYGGLIALALARFRPDRVATVSVFDPVAFGVLHEPPDPEGLADLAAAETDILRDEARGGGAEWFEAFVDYWNGPGSFRALPPPSREAFLRVGRKVFREVMALLEDRTPAPAYAHLGASLLVMAGERSPVAARRVAAVLVAGVPGARLAIVEGAGHMGPLTRSAEVNALVEGHIAAFDAA